MGIELQSQTRIVIGRLAAPSDPARPWWWQSTTTVDGGELILGGFAATENDAILEAAARTIDLRVAGELSPTPPTPVTPPPPDAWGLNGSSAPAHDPAPAGSASD